VNSLNVTQNKLRVLCERALRIYERHEQSDLVISTFGSTLVPAAQAYIQAYDDSRMHIATRNADMEAGHRVIDMLHGRIRTWIPVLSRDISGLSLGEMLARTDSPDHVIGDAQRLLSTVEAKKGSLLYAEKFLSDIGEALSIAREDWSVARTAIVEQQGLYKQVRELGAKASSELVAFRRVLRSVIGSSHHDYQSLRRTRIKQASDETEEVTEVMELDAPVAEAMAVSNGRATVPFGAEAATH